MSAYHEAVKRACSLLLSGEVEQDVVTRIFDVPSANALFQLAVSKAEGVNPSGELSNGVGELFNAEEAAELLGCSKHTVKVAHYQKRLPATKVAGRLRFKRADLRKFGERSPNSKIREAAQKL